MFRKHSFQSPPEIVSSGTSCRRVSPLACRRPFFFSVLAVSLGVLAAPVNAGNDDSTINLQQWQLRRLNQPTERERKQELDGRIYIYDGLTDRHVDDALTHHFERIEHMMFMGTVKTDASGEPLRDEKGNAVTESGGCQ